MAAWNRKTLKLCEKCLHFLEKRPFTLKFSKFGSESFHRLTDRRCVQMSQTFADEKSVKSCIIYLTKKNKISPASQTVATKQIAPKVCQGPLPTMYLDCSRFHPNRFTFGGVIAERVNTAKLPRKVNPIFEPNKDRSHWRVCARMNAVDGVRENAVARYSRTRVHGQYQSRAVSMAVNTDCVYQP